MGNAHLTLRHARLSPSHTVGARVSFGELGITADLRSLLEEFHRPVILLETRLTPGLPAGLAAAAHPP